MTQSDVDRDLLFGLVALQNGLIDHVQLVAGFQAWTRDRSRSLADYLLAGGALDDEQRSLLDGLVAQHLKKYGEDRERRLVDDAAPAAVANGRFSPDNPADPEATVDFAVRELTAAGERFLILRPHARGGLGQVSIALDVELHREVALKEIHPERADDDDSRARFIQEAEVTGRLEHPGVVPLYSLGCRADGRPFYAMRFVKGESLKDAIATFHQGPTSTPARPEPVRWNWALRQLLNRFIAICSAVDYAHSRGVIHRDLKPANILLGPYGETIVVDWGLAKVVGRRDLATRQGTAEATLRLESASGTADTVAGTAVGTPSYMSPEQAEGQVDALGPASDIYGLGATLYSLLVGRSPFTAPDVATVLSDVRRGVFDPPRQVNPRVPPALEAICLKAMALRPDRRYPSARSLAADLELWLADEPVSVYREPLSTRITRWGRRHGTLAAATGALLITIVAALAISTALIGDEQARTERQRRKAVLNFEEAARQRDLAASMTDEANEKAAALERQLYINRITLAHRESQEDMARAEQFLDQCPPALRGWEWAYLKRLCHLDLRTLRGHAQSVKGLAFSPDGTMIVSGDGKRNQEPKAGDTAELIVWDARTGHERRRLRGIRGGVNAVTFLGDGTRVAAGSGYYDRPPGGEGRVTIWDVATGRTVFEKSIPYRNVLAVALSPHDSLIAAGCGIASSDQVKGQLLVWEVATGRMVSDQEVSVGGVNSLAFSPDGKRIALACKDLVELWDVTPPRKVRAIKGHEGWVNGVAFSPDGKTLATAGWDKVIRLWDPESGNLLLTIDKHNGSVSAVKFSPDGRRLASASADHTLRVWERSNGHELLTLRGHAMGVNSVAFSPDGEQLASAGDDRTVKLWDAKTDRRVAFQEHRRWVNAIAFSPDGRRVASGDGDGIIAVWDPATGRRWLQLEGRNGWVNSVAFSPDGKTLASTGEYGQLHLWDAATGARVRTIEKLDAFARGVAFSPDGTRLVACTGAHDFIANVPGLIYVWDPGTGAEVLRFRGHSGRVLGLAFFPDGNRIASFSSQRPGQPDPVPEILVWKAATGEVLQRLQAGDRTIRCLAIGPDGRWLAAGADEGTVRIWEAASGTELRRIAAASQPILSLAFSPDGTRLAIGDQERTIKLWDPASGEAILTLSGHTDGITALAFSGDGSRLASASMDHTVRIWDATPVPDDSDASGP